MARRNQTPANDHITSIAARDTEFSAVERERLEVLRDAYAQGLDLFSASELAHLRFLRWLVQSGRLTV